MLRALAFAAALVVAPSLPHKVTVVRVPTMNATSEAKALRAIFPDATFAPMGQSQMIVIGDAQTIELVKRFAQPLCPCP